jgi:hypothetical protein
MGRVRTVAPAAATLLVLAAVAGCASRSAPPALSEVTGKTSAVCVEPRDGQRVYTYGHDMTRNVSDEPVTITSVEFSQSDGLKIIARRALFTKTWPYGLVGIVGGWPPDSELDGMSPPEVYLKAPQAKGLVVPPDAQNPVSWMIAFRVEKLPARAKPLVITYEDQDGKEHTWHGSVYVEVGDCLDDTGSSMPDDPRGRG